MVVYEFYKRRLRMKVEIKRGEDLKPMFIVNSLKNEEPIILTLGE